MPQEINKRFLRLSLEQWKRVFPFVVYMFLLSTGLTLARSARDALFLLHPALGARALPWMYLLSSLVGLFPPLLFNFLGSRMDLKRISQFSSLVFGGSALVSFILTLHQTASNVVVVYLLIQSIQFTTFIQFWSLASESFDTRESKRIFPIISASNMIGTIVGGFICPFFSKFMSPEYLFSVWLGIAILAGIVLNKNILAKVNVPDRKVGRHLQKTSFKEDMQQTWNNPLTKTLLIYVLFLGPVFSVINYQFSVLSSIKYSRKEDLTSFLGMFNGIIGVCSIFAQFFITPVLIKTLGVGRSILLHPMFLLSSTAWMAFQFGFYSSTFANGGNMVLLNALHDTVITLLFNALPSLIRSQTRNVIVGMIRPVTCVLAFLIIKLIIPQLPPEIVCGFLFILCAAGLFYALRIHGTYLNTLIATLSEGSRVEQDQEEILRTRESVQAVRLALQSSDPLKVASAIRTAGDLKMDALRPEIWKGLYHKNPMLRSAALEAFGALGNPKDLALVIEFSKDPNPKVRKCVVEALSLLGGKIDHFLSFTEESDPMVRKAAVGALLRIGGEIEVRTALDFLNRMVHSEIVEDRLMAARILSETQSADFVPLAIHLLKDSNLTVERRAIRALGKMGGTSYTMLLVNLLGEPHLEQAVRYSLVNGIGEKAIPALMEGLRSNLKEVRRGCAKVLSQIASKESLNIFMELLTDKDSLVCDAALIGIATVGSKWNAPFKLPKSCVEYLERLSQQHIRKCYLHRQGRELMAHKFSGPAGDFLVEVMTEDEMSSIKWAILSMGLILRPKEVLEIWNRLENKTDKIFYQTVQNKNLDYRKALAMEVFENLGRSEMTKPLLPLLDPQEELEIVKWKKEYLPSEAWNKDYYFKTLSQHSSGVVRAVFAHALQQTEDENNIKWLDSFKKDPNKIVMEVVNNYNSRGSKTMISAIEKIIFLRGVHFFHYLEREELSHIVSICEEVHFETKSKIFSAGDIGDSLYLIMNGQVRIIASNGRTIAILNSHDCFGEMSLLDNEKRSASAVTETECALLKITRDEFRELILEQPTIAFGLFQLLSSRLRESIQTISPLTSIPSQNALG